MERDPQKSEILDRTEFAVNLYNAVDWLFDRRGVRPLFTLDDTRHSELLLTPKELEYVGPRIEPYAIDAPNLAKIQLSGHNPYIYPNGPGGAIKITMEHGGDPEKPDVVTSEYRICLPTPDQDMTPVTLSKQVSARYGKHADSATVDEIIHVARPLVYEEQRALRALINML